MGAAELSLIQEAIAERFGSAGVLSPASIARVLADHGVRLGHPDVIQTDSRWREQHLFGFFTPDELAFSSIESATALIEKIERLHEKFQTDEMMRDHLRQLLRRIKTELELVANSERGDRKRRELAEEFAQWLTIWLQNQRIFTEWLALRRATADFQARFHS